MTDEPGQGSPYVKYTVAEREAAAATFRALENNRALTMEEALDFGLMGWNLRCTLCGSFGAEWVRGLREASGSLAFCPGHRDEWRIEQNRHSAEVTRLSAPNFTQPSSQQVDAALMAYRAARKPRRS